MTLLEVKALKKPIPHTVRRPPGACFDQRKLLRGGRRVPGHHGESGSGKTTLLNIVASLDQPHRRPGAAGGKDLGSIPERNLADFRRKNLGFVFQDFNLLDTFSIRDNIYLPLVLSRCEPRRDGPPLSPLAKKAGHSGHSGQVSL